MKQRITWTSFIEVDLDEGLNWESATTLAMKQMVQTDEAYMGKVIRIEVVEDE